MEHDGAALFSRAQVCTPHTLASSSLFYTRVPRAQMVDRKSRSKDAVTREYTINLNKRLHKKNFKKKAPRAITEIRKFASKAMGTKDVRVDVKLNKAVWSKVRAWWLLCAGFFDGLGNNVVFCRGSRTCPHDSVFASPGGLTTTRMPWYAAAAHISVVIHGTHQLSHNQPIICTIMLCATGGDVLVRDRGRRPLNQGEDHAGCGRRVSCPNVCVCFVLSTPACNHPCGFRHTWRPPTTLQRRPTNCRLYQPS